jgi:signal transduction histidine kinase
VEHGGGGGPANGRSAAGITVTVGAMDDGFYVADDGPGIPESERDRIFETGYSTNEDGTGVGLDVVREIVEAHGWAVTVTESETGGARFELTELPPTTTDAPLRTASPRHADTIVVTFIIPRPVVGVDVGTFVVRVRVL